MKAHPRIKKAAKWGVAVAAISLAAACARQYPMAAFVPMRHVVIVDLKDPGDYREFGEDCFQFLFIPGVVNTVTGPGLDTGQPESIRECNVAVVLDLTNAEACRALPEQAAYAAFLDKWRGRSNSIRVVTFGPRCEDDGVEGGKK